MRGHIAVVATAVHPRFEETRCFAKGIFFFVASDSGERFVDAQYRAPFIGNNHAFLTFKGNRSNAKIVLDLLTSCNILERTNAPNRLAGGALIQFNLGMNPDDFAVDQQAEF